MAIGPSKIRGLLNGEGWTAVAFPPPITIALVNKFDMLRGLPNKGPQIDEALAQLGFWSARVVFDPRSAAKIQARTPAGVLSG
jgi:hypothetical protein